MRYQILRATKLTTFGNLAASGQHTWRERPTPNADATRTPLNVDLRPIASASELVNAVRRRVGEARQRAERPVLCIEYLITASPEAFARHAGGNGLPDKSTYFRDALAHFEQLHGANNIVAANLQLDERSPHLVIYAVPLVESAARRRKRSVIVGTGPNGEKLREVREYEEPATVKLSAAHFLDGRAKLAKLQTDFHLAVGRKHGLERGKPGSQARHSRVKRFYSQMAGRTPSYPELSLPQAGLLETKASYGVRVQEAIEKKIAPLIEPLFARSQALDVARENETSAERRRKAAERRTALALQSEQASRQRAESLSREIAQLLAGLSSAEAQQVLDAYRAAKKDRDRDHANSRGMGRRFPPK